MPPSASAAALYKPRTGARLVPALLVAGLGVLAADYLGGVLLLALLHGEVARASPLTLARYAYYYGDQRAIRARIMFCGGAALACVIVSGVLVRLPRRPALHGEARFATRADVRRAGFFGTRGLILGQWGHEMLLLAGQQGVAVVASPRSGKGAGVGIPNALHWPDSLLVLDIKFEIWRITAGFRAECGQACYLFAPFATDARTARWNPLTYVSEDPRLRVNDLQRIAEMLYPDPPNVDPFWTASARSLFLGIALYLFETTALPKTLGEILRQGMASDAEGFGAHWKRIIEGRSSGSRPLSGECVRALYDIIDLAPVTASSIRKTFTSRLDLFANPLVDAATSASDFDLRELRSTRLSIYVGVNPDDLHRLAPLLNLFFQQAVGLQTRELPENNPALKYQLLCLLDELASVGRMKILAEAAPYLPGYNVRLLLMFHTQAQLREIYGAFNAETIMKSLAARVVFAAKDISDAREISDELGFTTVKVKSISKPLWDWDAKSRRARSQNVSEQRRALLLPQEVKELGTEEAIVFYEGLRPIRCRKIRYFLDPRFTARLRPPPERPSPHWQPPDACALAHTAIPAEDVSPDIQSDVTPQTHLKESPVSQAATYEATAADVERLEELQLEDYAVDFSRVKIPEHEGPLTTEELVAAAQSFVETLQEASRAHHG